MMMRRPLLYSKNRFQILISEQSARLNSNFPGVLAFFLPIRVGTSSIKDKAASMFAFLQPLLYIQVTPERVTIRNLRTDTTLSEAAELALGQQGGGKPRVLVVGARAPMAAAAEPGARLIRPFAHPRSLVSDFLSADLLLRTLVKQSLGKGLLAVSPRVVMHPVGSPEGGFTAVERRAFRELALGAGASHVEVWTGRPLTDDELRSRRFPADGGQVDGG